MGSKYFFHFLSVHPFSTGGFFTFLVALAHGVAHSNQPDCRAHTVLHARYIYTLISLPFQPNIEQLPGQMNAFLL